MLSPGPQVGIMMMLMTLSWLRWWWQFISRNSGREVFFPNQSTGEIKVCGHINHCKLVPWVPAKDTQVWISKCSLDSEDTTGDWLLRACRPVSGRGHHRAAPGELRPNKGLVCFAEGPMGHSDSQTYHSALTHSTHKWSPRTHRYLIHQPQMHTHLIYTHPHLPINMMSLCFTHITTTHSCTHSLP